MNTLNTVMKQPVVNAPAYNPSEENTKMNTLSLNTFYAFDAELVSIESSTTFTFTQGTRKNNKGEKIGKGLRLVITAPNFLKAHSFPAESVAAKVYEFGAEETLKNVIRKYVKDNNIEADTGAVMPEITDTMIQEYFESSGTKLLTKESILLEVENNIAESLTVTLVEKGIDESKIPAVIAQVGELLAKLASPATKYNDEIKEKLITILEAANETPVITGLINRLNKKDEPVSNVLDLI